MKLRRLRAPGGRGRHAGLAGFACLLVLTGTSAAFAQVGLPDIRLPGLPTVEVDRTVNDVAGVVDARRLTDLRRLQVAELIRTQRPLIDTDPRGAPVVRNEVVAFSPSDAALEKARAEGFTVIRERVLEELDAKVVILQAPPGWSTHRALKRLRAIDRQGAYDFNHLYTRTGVVGGASTVGAARRVPWAMSRLALISAPNPKAGKVGLIDSGVDVSHPAFGSTVVHTYGCEGGAIVSQAHGTAVASLILGTDKGFHGAAPGAELFAADVYCGKPTGGAADAVVDALGWMAREKVAVINVSLVGPANILLGNVIRMLVARGYIVVAAVGNDGPAAPPLYPAAYPEVVGVTGVDVHRRVLLEAGRGRQVDFSAPGSDMAAASFGRGYAPVRGTSFAAPIVAGLLATMMQGPDPSAAERAVAALSEEAIDLGARGPDTTYGKGLVGDPLRPSLAGLP